MSFFTGRHFGDKFKTEEGKEVILLTEPQRATQRFIMAYPQKAYIHNGVYRSYATYIVDKDGKNVSNNLSSLIEE